MSKYPNHTKAMKYRKVSGTDFAIQYKVNGADIIKAGIDTISQ